MAAIVEGNPSHAEVLQRLGALGDSRLLVRTSNVMDITRSSRLIHGSRVPSVQDVVVSAGGTITPSVTYKEVGSIVGVTGRWNQDEPPRANLDCSIEVSDILSSSVEVSSGVKLPVFSEVKIDRALPVESGQPAWTMSTGVPAPNDREGTTSVILVRFVATRL